MDGQRSLEAILGNTPPPAPMPPAPPAPDAVPGGESGVSGVPPAPIPGPPPPSDPNAHQNAGLLAALQAERASRQRMEQDMARLLAAQGQGNRPPAAPAAPAPQPPRRDQYATAEEFQVDYMAWLARESVSEVFQQFQQEDAQRRQQAQIQDAQQRRQFALESVATEARMSGLQKYPDYDATVNTGLAPFLHVSPALHEGLLDLGKMTFEVAYYLGKNPAKTAEIVQLGSSRAIDRALGLLEDQLKKAAVSPSPAPTLPPLAGGAPAVPGITNPPLPATLTQSRGANGQYASSAPPAWAGPKPLSEILKWKP